MYLFCSRILSNTYVFLLINFVKIIFDLSLFFFSTQFSILYSFFSLFSCFLLAAFQLKFSLSHTFWMKNDEQITQKQVWVRKVVDIRWISKVHIFLLFFSHFTEMFHTLFNFRLCCKWKKRGFNIFNKHFYHREDGEKFYYL